MKGDPITKSIAAQNTYSDWFLPKEGKPFNFSISGTWVATVTVERKKITDAAAVSVATHTANIETSYEENEANVLWRFGVATGNYTSGTVVGSLSQ